jgi:hypothetical protein
MNISRKLRAQPDSPQRQAALVTLSGLFHKPEEVVAEALRVYNAPPTPPTEAEVSEARAALVAADNAGADEETIAKLRTEFVKKKWARAAAGTS